MSKISKNLLYKIASDRIRQNRQTFYDLNRERDEDIKTWFDRIQSIVRCCKFARCRQFLIIDKFICELDTDEIERIKRALTDSWTLQQLNKYFVDENLQTKRTKSVLKTYKKNVVESRESPAKAIKCEVVSNIFWNEK